MDNEIIGIDDVNFKFEADEYYCVTIEEDTFAEEAEKIFLSKEYVTRDGDSFLMPEWYATNKGLI